MSNPAWRSKFNSRAGLRYDVVLMSTMEKKTKMKPGATPGGRPRGPNLFALLTPYRPLIITLVAMTIFGNSLNLLVPRLIANAIDTYQQQQLVLPTLIVEFSMIALGILLF